mmetsp:Transcript_39507/g.97060  ORF Transcript_39507/g.97060 Transcript_39507/m.97060 type:complete len:631 (-) Transcript_39507:113-2005(-)
MTVALEVALEECILAAATLRDALHSGGVDSGRSCVRTYEVNVAIVKQLLQDVGLLSKPCSSEGQYTPSRGAREHVRQTQSSSSTTPGTPASAQKPALKPIDEMPERKRDLRAIRAALQRKAKLLAEHGAPPDKLARAYMDIRRVQGALDNGRPSVQRRVRLNLQPGSPQGRALPRSPYRALSSPRRSPGQASLSSAPPTGPMPRSTSVPALPPPAQRPSATSPGVAACLGPRSTQSPHLQASSPGQRPGSAPAPALFAGGSPGQRRLGGSPDRSIGPGHSGLQSPPQAGVPAQHGQHIAQHTGAAIGHSFASNAAQGQRRMQRAPQRHPASQGQPAVCPASWQSSTPASRPPGGSPASHPRSLARTPGSQPQPVLKSPATASTAVPATPSDCWSPDTTGIGEVSEQLVADLTAVLLDQIWTPGAKSSRVGSPSDGDSDMSGSRVVIGEPVRLFDSPQKAAQLGLQPRRMLFSPPSRDKAGSASKASPQVVVQIAPGAAAAARALSRSPAAHASSLLASPPSAVSARSPGSAHAFREAIGCGRPTSPVPPPPFPAGQTGRQGVSKGDVKTPTRRVRSAGKVGTSPSTLPRKNEALSMLLEASPICMASPGFARSPDGAWESLEEARSRLRR